MRPLYIFCRFPQPLAFAAHARVVLVLKTHPGVLVSETIGGFFLVVETSCEGGAGGAEERYGLQWPCLRIDSSFFALLCGTTKLIDEEYERRTAVVCDVVLQGDKMAPS